MSSHRTQAETGACAHDAVSCLNPHELIRKYRCEACAGVMMCACAEDFGRRFLSHQLAEGTELRTQKRVAVTLGFQPKVCAECRGLPAEPAPAGEIHGRTSKVKRYYWRELFFEKTRRTADWDDDHPEASEAERRTAHDAIEMKILDDIKAQHARAPKYVFSDISQAEVLERNRVEVVAISADYAEAPQKGAVICDGDAVISPETFVTRLYEAQGWSVMPLESLPFHALFGVMMWLLIQDAADPRVRMVGFGDRMAYEARRKPPMIWSLLPEDFGCEGYSLRRKRAVERHFGSLPGHRDGLLWVFDYWRPLSANLRQYLWAHREGDVDRARRLIEILTPTQILTVLRYLLDDYWRHYLGWPDLLLYRGENILLLEVKSSKDHLSQPQKRWISDNYDRLGLPFKLIKLHRTSSNKRP
ncbi:MAG: VRR-NUC domain-containing protein [Alphaproteobacteria bacterium]